ncbi:hypothetical protein CDIK_0088 [Cucumispora dikerogammari]|nr:hypothetical protein CDIK_0088 [Cucumispora dikerogammari]
MSGIPINEIKIYLIVLFSNLSIYACSIYYFSVMRKAFDLPLSYNYKLLALNGIGIVGNFGFSYWAFKTRNHRLIAGILIIVQSLAFLGIKILCRFSQQFLKNLSLIIIGTTNAISNGGFNPVYDSLAINYLEIHNRLAKINTLRCMLALGNFFTGIIMIIIRQFFTKSELVPMGVSFIFSLIAAFLIYTLHYDYSLSSKKKEKHVYTSIPLLEIIKYFLKWNFIIFYLVTILNGSYKLYYTMLQRDQFLSFGLSDNDMDLIKTIGCLSEIGFSFIFHFIENIVTFKILFPVSVSLNVIKFFMFAYLNVGKWKKKVLIFMIMESVDKIVFYVTSVSGNRIILDICKTEFLTLAQGMRYACFIGLGCLVSGLSGINLRNSHKQVLKPEDFIYIFERTKYMSCVTIIMCVILMILLFSNKNNSDIDSEAETVF